MKKLRQAKEIYDKVQKGLEAAEKIKQGAALIKGGAATVAFFAETWWVWLILLAVVLVVLLIYSIFGGVGNKILDAAGGSVPITLDFQNNAHKALVADVLALQRTGKLLVTDSLAKDLDWQTDADGKAVHVLDWRVMETLKYLGNKWDVIGVKLLRSNGPGMTRRRPAAKGEEGKDTIDAPSAYRFGQAIAIDRIGVTSPALTEAMGLDEPVPVQVNWQKTMRENDIRGLYEALQVDARRFFLAANQAAAQAKTNAKGLAVLAQAHDQAVADAAQKPQAKITDIYMEAMTTLADLLIEVQRLRGEPGLDDRTTGFTAPAVANLEKAQANLDKSGVAFIEEWGDDATRTAIRTGLQAVFRAMQVANVSGWRGNTKEIGLWKAYEARQNIRQLELELLRMPVELGGDKGFNGDLVVKQLIVYSPEDDLDNGLPDFDVYPDGATAVDEGGVGYDTTHADKQIDVRDNHFMALPIDNGIFSKAATVFIHQSKTAGEWVGELAVEAVTPFRYLYDLFDGGGVEKVGEDNVQISYRNFVHVGF